MEGFYENLCILPVIRGRSTFVIFNYLSQNGGIICGNNVMKTIKILSKKVTGEPVMCLY
jgi:hypothetical protein